MHVHWLGLTYFKCKNLILEILVAILGTANSDVKYSLMLFDVSIKRCLNCVLSILNQPETQLHFILSQMCIIINGQNAVCLYHIIRNKPIIQAVLSGFNYLKLWQEMHVITPVCWLILIPGLSFCFEITGGPFDMGGGGEWALEDFEWKQIFCSTIMQ